jgi:vanillate O-demethylase monooxygenase subunit
VAIPSLGGSGRIPPRARCAAPYGVSERYGLVFVAPEEPIVPLPEIEAYGEPERVRVDCEPFTGEFGAAFLIDNQLDMAHFAFVHRNTFGTVEAAEAPSYEVEREPWGFTVDADIAIAASNDPGVELGERPLEQYRRMHYHYRAPFHVELRLDYPVMGGSTVITFFVQPETTTRSTMYVTLLFAQPGGFTDEALEERVAFEYRVIGEDLALQTRFDVTGFPLELTRECHVRADRASVEYRRLLRALTEHPVLSALDGPATGTASGNETGIRRRVGAFGG